MEGLHKYQQLVEETRQRILAGTFKADALQKLDLIIQVENKVAGREDILSISIRNAIQGNEPGVLQMIRDLAHDNFKLIADILGYSLTHKILRYE